MQSLFNSELAAHTLCVKMTLSARVIRPDTAIFVFGAELLMNSANSTISSEERVDVSHLFKLFVQTCKTNF